MHHATIDKAKRALVPGADHAPILEGALVEWTPGMSAPVGEGMDAPVVAQKEHWHLAGLCNHWSAVAQISFVGDRGPLWPRVAVLS